MMIPTTEIKHTLLENYGLLNFLFKISPLRLNQTLTPESFLLFLPGPSEVDLPVLRIIFLLQNPTPPELQVMN